MGEIFCLPREKGFSALSVSLRLTAPPKGELGGAFQERVLPPPLGRWHGGAVTERAERSFSSYPRPLRRGQASFRKEVPQFANWGGGLYFAAGEMCEANKGSGTFVGRDDLGPPNRYAG